jgi:hypothetical protein
MKKEDEVRRFLENRFDPAAQYEKIKSYTNAFDSNLYESSFHEKYEVNIKPDLKAPLAKFIPTLNPREFMAHPITIRAMRKEIFMGGDEFVDLEKIITCHSCKNTIDMQFWIFCPYCEASF